MNFKCRKEFQKWAKEMNLDEHGDIAEAAWEAAWDLQQEQIDFQLERIESLEDQKLQ